MTRAKIRRQVLFPDTVADADIVVPQKKKRKAGEPFEYEWQLQATCVKFVRDVMRKDPDLNYLATMTEGQRNPVRANVAKMMGLRRGPSDLLLMRRMVLKVTGINSKEITSKPIQIKELPRKPGSKEITTNQGVNAVPSGYFGIFKEMADMIVTLGQAGLHIDASFVPDILGQYPPLPLPLCKLAWVEFKLPGKKLTPEQAAWHAWFAGIAERHVVRDVESFRAILAAF